MKTKTINIYEFSELSEEAKEKFRKKWYENEDYPFLEDDLTESVTSLLKQKGCTYENINVLYSLSCSQGDGLCFSGAIFKGEKRLELTHNYRYYFASSVEMGFYDKEEEINGDPELENIYLDICREVEKNGYTILDYRMTDQEFQELCEANEYGFDENGNMI